MNYEYFKLTTNILYASCHYYVDKVTIRKYFSFLNEFIIGNLLSLSLGGVQHYYC